MPQHPDAGMYGWTDMQECSCANDRGDVGLWGSVMNKILISHRQVQEEVVVAVVGMEAQHRQGQSRTQPGAAGTPSALTQE